jgi:hypothetical protein
MREIQQCHGSKVKQEQTQCVVSTWRSRGKVLEHLGIASTYKITLQSRQDSIAESTDLNPPFPTQSGILFSIDATFCPYAKYSAAPGESSTVVPT